MGIAITCGYTSGTAGFCRALSPEDFFPFLLPSSLPPLPLLLPELGFESAGPPLCGMGDKVWFEPPFPSDKLASFFGSSSKLRCSLSPEDRSFLRVEPASAIFPESFGFFRDSGDRSASFSFRCDPSPSCSCSSFGPSGGDFSFCRIKLEENVRGADGRERARRTDVKDDRKVALFLGEAKNGWRSRGRGVWWSAALQGSVWPRSMLFD